MAVKKKARTSSRSAKTTGTARKKVAHKAAATKKPGRAKAKAAARKSSTTKQAVSAKSKKPASKAKTAGTGASVKPSAKTAAAAAAAAAQRSKAVKAISKLAAAKRAAAAAPKKAAAPRAVAAAKPTGQKITAPVPASAKGGAARPIVAPKRPAGQRNSFKSNEYIVYPAHGVGRVVGVEEQEIAGLSLELYVINFEKEKLTLRVPTGKLESVGMRKLSDENLVKKAMDTLKGRARVKRTMWSRRAQEYVAKINSGDLISIAEVVRDLYRSDAQPEQSYSERQLYEDALDRMAREIAAVEKLDERGAVQKITDVLSKSARGRRLAAEEAENGDDGSEVKAA